MILFFIGFGMVAGAIFQYVFANFIRIEVSLKIMLIIGAIGGLLAYMKEAINADENQNNKNNSQKW